MTQDQAGNVIVRDALAGEPQAGYHVLVPVANPATLDALVDFASAVARRKKGEVTVLHVVADAGHCTPDEARRTAEGRRAMLEESVSGRRDRSVAIHTIARVSENIPAAVLATAREEAANLIIMGWQGHVRSRAWGPSLGHVLDPVIDRAPCDVAVVKTKGLDHPRRIMVPTAGGPNAILALDLALALSWRNRGELHLVTVARKGREDAARANLAATLAAVKTRQRVRQDVLVGDDPARTILRESREFDLIALGATRETVFRQVFFGTVPEHVAKRCAKTVIMVKGYQGPLVTLVRQGRSRWRELLHRLRGGSPPEKSAVP
jgi:nucleotide-binding universal stress UspA family protein